MLGTAGVVDFALGLKPVKDGSNEDSKQGGGNDASLFDHCFHNESFVSSQSHFGVPSSPVQVHIASAKSNLTVFHFDCRVFKSMREDTVEAGYIGRRECLL